MERMIRLAVVARWSNLAEHPWLARTFEVSNLSAVFGNTFMLVFTDHWLLDRHVELERHFFFIPIVAPAESDVDPVALVGDGEQAEAAFAGANAINPFTVGTAFQRRRLLKRGRAHHRNGCA